VAEQITPMEIKMANITGDSPEAVAFALLERIADAEAWSGRVHTLDTPTSQWEKPRKEILETYAECLRAVQQRP
jgi:hypothetical protein